jgi:hypothetical protein
MNARCESIGQPEAAACVTANPSPVRAQSIAVRTTVLCLLGVAFNALIFGPSLELTSRGFNDFMSVYSGARLAFSGQMYEVGPNLAIQREAAGWENINHLFMRPPFDALLLWPLGRLPYVPAAWMWEGLIVVCTAAFCMLWPGDRRSAALACCWSFPLFHVFANGQDIALILLLVALAAREMRRGREGVAGAIFAACSIKFHLLLLLPVLIVSQRRWRFLGGLASGGAILFALSFLPGGLNWPVKYAALLRNPIGNPWPESMPNIHGLTFALPASDVWERIGYLAVLGLTWVACRGRSFEYGLAAVLVGGVLVAPHAYLSDCAMLIPALLITLPLAGQGAARTFHLFVMSPVCTIWAMLHPTWVTTMSLVAYLAFLSFPPREVRVLAEEARG